MMTEMDPEGPCPCGSGLPLNRCCGPFVSGSAAAPSAESLMRSRYTAYVLGDPDYLLATWDPHTRPGALSLDPDQHWLGLRILRTSRGTERDDAGEVEFVARFKTDGRGTRLHEVSRFRKEEDRWLYVDGTRGSTDSTLKG